MRILFCFALCRDPTDNKAYWVGLNDLAVEGGRLSPKNLCQRLWSLHGMAAILLAFMKPCASQL